MDGRESLSSQVAASLWRRHRRMLALWERWCQSPAASRLPGLAIFAGSNGVACLLVWQTLSAPLPMGPGLLLLLGTLLSGLAFVGRMLLGESRLTDLTSAQRWGLGVAAAAPGLILAGLSWGGAPMAALLTGGVAVATGLVVAQGTELKPVEWLACWREAAGWTQGFRTQENGQMLGTVAEFPRTGFRPSAQSAGAMHPVQWMQRSVDAGGAEHLEGVLQVDFPAGQSTVTVHVAFCPPFQRTPAFQCEASSAADVRLRASVAYPYGARVELKRSGSNAAPLSLELQFAAHSAVEAKRAA